MSYRLLLSAAIFGALFAQDAGNLGGEARRAQELAAAGRPEEAARIYRALLRATPENPVLLLNLCIAEYKARQFTEAATHAQAALALQPGLLPARLFLGAARFELSEFEKAAGALEQVVAASPGDRNARLMLGEALLGMSKPGQAAVHLQAAAEMLPDSPRVWYGLGRAREMTGARQAASEAWDRLASLPPSPESHMHMAQVQDAGQRWREAAAEWRAALKLAPESRTARIGAGWALFRLRDYEAAMSVLKPLLTSDRAEVQFLQGASLLNLQQPIEAMRYLRAAIARDPAMLPARAALGQALLQTGKAEEAIPLLRDAMAVDPDGATHFQLFRAYQLTHREAEARQALAAYRRLRESGVPSP